jgi:hypothetical protein
MPIVVLREDEVLAIYEMAKSGQYTHQEIADAYGIAKSNVSHIKSGRNWAHVTKPKGNDNG